MHIRVFINSLIGILLPFLLVGQQLVSISDLDKATALSKIHFQSDFYSTKHETTVKFTVSKPKNGDIKVLVDEEDQYEILSLKPNAWFNNSITYDFESGINSITGYNKNNVRDLVSISDYSFSEFYTTDTRYKLYGRNFAKVGERFGFKTSRSFYDIKYFTSIYFHEFFPQEEKRIVIEIPEWLDLELKEMNFEGYAIEKTVVQEKKFKRITYKIKDTFGAIRQNNTPGPSHFLPHVLLLAKSVTIDQKQFELLKSPDHLYKWYRGLVLTVENNKEPLKAKVSELIKGKTTDEEKIKSIYYWVQDNILYLAYEAGLAGFKPAAAQDVFKRKYGDCKGMANLCKEMLIIAGYDARLTWIGTRRIAYDYSIPSLSVDNHMICTVILNEKPIYLDGTEKYGLFSFNAFRIQGRPVMIENGENYKLDKVPAYVADSNLFYRKRIMRIEGDDLVGTNLQRYKNDYKTNILNEYYAIKSEHKEDALVYFLSKNKSELVANIATKGLENRDEQLVFTNDYVFKHNVIKNGNEMYLSLDYSRDFNNFNFDSTRIYDYEFAFNQLRVQEVSLTIPAGYKVTRMPKNINIDEHDFSMEISHTIVGNELIYTKKIKIKDGIVRKKYFTQWNQAIKELNKFYKEQIILTQI